MIASANSLYDTRRRSFPGPAMVREPTGVRLDANPPPSGSENAPNRAAGDDDDDELRKLGERIAELAARINSAEARMMTLIAEFDRRGGWKDGGYSSCAEWLAWRIGTKIGTARERVRTARALERLPQTADALKHGTISYAKVRALTRVATPQREAELLEFARAGSAAKLERTVRMWKKLSRDAELTAEQARRRSRTFSVFVDGDGMYVVKGRLEPEVGAVLMRAVEAASDALFRREEGAGSGSHGGDAHDAAGSGRGVSCEAGDARPEPKQRRADALGLLAERALAAGFGAAADRDAGRPIANAAAPEPPFVDEGRASFSGEGQTSFNGDGQASPNGEERTSSHGDGQASPNGEGPTSSHGDPLTAPRVGSGTRAERYQVMVHCDAATLAAEGEPGRSDLDGIRVSAETSRRMACDAAVVAMVHAKDGSMLNVGRRTRTIPPHIRRALEERDRGCRFPGCGCRFTEAHHVKHWADGGETSLRNTLLLCRRHHRAVHEGRVKVSVNGDGTVLFFTPKGRMLVDAPSKPKAARGGERPGLPPVPTVHPGAPAQGDGITLSNGAALYHDSEIPWEIEAAAREALDESLETDRRKSE